MYREILIKSYLMMMKMKMLNGIMDSTTKPWRNKREIEINFDGIYEYLYFIKF